MGSPVTGGRLPRLDIVFPDQIVGSDRANAYALEAIRTFASNLEVEQPFEVWYPTTTAADYDVVRVDTDGEILPVLPYDPAEAQRVADFVRGVSS